MAKLKLKQKTLNIAGKDVVVGEEPITEAPPKDVKLTPEEIVLYEREIRRYIKKSGGYRKGVSNKDQALCVKLLQAMGRSLKQGEALTWNTDIVIDGIDKPTVRGMVQRD